MSTMTIAGNWIEFPLSTSVPSRTSFHIRSRVLRLELAVVTTLIAFGYLAWQTLGQEGALQEAAANQSRSIATLADTVARQDREIAGLNGSVEKATRDLAAQLSRVSIQLQAQDKEMAGIQARLRCIEISLRSSGRQPD